MVRGNRINDRIDRYAAFSNPTEYDQVGRREGQREIGWVRGLYAREYGGEGGEGREGGLEEGVGGPGGKGEGRDGSGMVI